MLKQWQIGCAVLACFAVLGPVAFAKNNGSGASASQPKTQQQMMDMLDNFEKAPPPPVRNDARYAPSGYNRSVHRLPPARRMPVLRHPTMGGRQNQLMQMMQQAQGGAAGPGAAGALGGAAAGGGPQQFLQMLQGAAAGGGAAGGGGQEQQFMQLLQKMQSMRGGAPGGAARGGAPSSGAPPMMASPRPMQNAGRGSLGLLKPAQPAPAASTQSGSAADLEKMMEAQYGR